MKRILVLAYYFPPVGGAGVQRSVKFVRYLPSFGYTPMVITGSGSQPGRWTPLDRSLTNEIPLRTAVHRIASVEPPASVGVHARAERWIGLRPPFARWWIQGVVAVGQSIGLEAALIYASMSPFESGEAAAALAHDLRRPWVADLRDPWALDEIQVFPSGIHRRAELNRMSRVLRSAAAIVMNTPEAKVQLLRHFPELHNKPVVVIPNGFDTADFEHPVPPRTDGSFRIVHTGYLHTELGRRHRRLRRIRRLLGGAAPGVDLLTRSHVDLLEAVDRLVAKQPELRSILEVHLAGVVSKSDLAAAQSDVVQIDGYLDHDESVALMRSADLLYLPMHNLPRGVRARIVPGKTYEYLASGRPILATVPDGDARDLLQRSRVASCCRPADVDCMELVLSEHVRRFRSEGRWPSEPRPDFLRAFERRHLAETLAALFDSVLDGTTSRLLAQFPRRSEKCAPEAAGRTRRP
jgi:glycosyltransferase involved in cell wall biosynthesis